MSSAQPQSKLMLTSAQIEFLAEDTEVQVIPEFTSDAIRLLSGSYGPFQPSYPTLVPLWVALLLKHRRRCRIVPPDWLTYVASIHFLSFFAHLIFFSFSFIFFHFLSS